MFKQYFRAYTFLLHFLHDLIHHAVPLFLGMYQNDIYIAFILKQLLNHTLQAVKR